jgi:hypothetical protein
VLLVWVILLVCYSFDRLVSAVSSRAPFWSSCIFDSLIGKLKCIHKNNKINNNNDNDNDNKNSYQYNMMIANHCISQ